MYSEYNLCLQSAVYVLRVQFMSLEYSLFPKSTLYVHRVQFMVSLEYSLFPQSTVYVLREQFMSSECSLCPKEYSLCISRIKFMYLQSTV